MIQSVFKGDAKMEEDIYMVAALDNNNVILGVYSVNKNRELPGVEFNTLVDYPKDPVLTGRSIWLLSDLNNPESELIEIDEKAWPEIGWTYSNNEWQPPEDVS